MKYIQGEVFTLEKQEEHPVTMTDEEINAKYKRGEIRIVTEQARYPVKSIKSMLESGDYKLNPEYQRRKRWDNGRKSRLIESFIMNVPLPPVFLYEYDYSKFEVMDGLQRLTAVDDFYCGRFPLENLEYWKELEGKKYAELPEEIQKGIDRRYISSVVLLEETAKTEKEAEELKQIVFERLNSGGEKLTPQETRNALYNGKFNQLCLKLSKNESFRKMWQIPLESDGEAELLKSEAYRKMDDVQLVLRFFAYRFLDNLSGTTIEDFLDEYLKQANKFPDNTLFKLEKLFAETVETIYQVFGEEAFFSPIYERKVKKPQKTIYDPLMQSVAKNIIKKNVLLENATEIKENKYRNDIYEEDGSKFFEGRNTTLTDIKNRIQYFDNLFQTYIR
jgi:hypothetical protein